MRRSSSKKNGVPCLRLEVVDPAARLPVEHLGEAGGAGMPADDELSATSRPLRNRYNQDAIDLLVAAVASDSL